MTVSLENKFLRIILSSFLLAIFMIGLQTTFNTPAAHANTCGSTGACLGTVAQTVVSGGGTGGIGPITGPGAGSGPASVGPGGTVTAPSIPMVGSPGGGGTFGAYAYEMKVYMTTGVVFCPTKNINGFDVPSSGVVVAERRDLVGWTPTGNGYMPNYGGWYIVSTTCVYPPVSSAVVTRTCIIGYDATVDRMANSRLGAAGGVGSSAGTISSAAQLEADGEAACETQARVALSYNPPNGQNGWGQYQATSRIQQITCRFTTTSFNGNVDRLGDCGAVSSVPGTTARMTVWCDGYDEGWLMKDWTGSDCQNTNPGRLVCTIPTPAKYNGFAGNVQALRDGKEGTVLWGTPQVQGGWGMTNWRSSTVVNDGSSPRNTAISDNSEGRQLFASSIPFTSHMIGGQNLDQKLSFYTAGDAGSPFSMTRNYLYDSWFTSIHTEIRSIDLRSGNVGVSEYAESTFAVDNKCGPQVSPRIDVIRAIGDNIN